MKVPDEYIAAVAQVMVAAKWHTYQVLTKRSERLRNLLNTKLRFAAEQQHIWCGVSVEDKKYGLPRVEDLRNTNAEVRFLSVEPLLEDIGKLDLRARPGCPISARIFNFQPQIVRMMCSK